MFEAVGFLQSESGETRKSKEEIFPRGHGHMRLGKEPERMDDQDEGARWKVPSDF
jgi:hypothetical protein